MSRAPANNLQAPLLPQLSNGLQHQSFELRLDHSSPVDRLAATVTGYSRVPKTFVSSSMVDDRLEEVVYLLAVAMHRGRARKAEGGKFEKSAGLGPRTERVFRPEGGR